MSDRIVRAILADSGLTVVACVATGAARDARRRHGLATSSAALLGQGLAAGFLLASLQKGEKTRINLQLECDGPAQGFFVDADTSGNSRGYIRSKTVRFPLEPRFRSAPLLGTKGYVAVLRDIDGEFYRGQVELVDPDLTLSLEHYFAQSEQIATALQLEVLSEGEDELGWVGGVLVQRLPDGDEREVEKIRARLRGGALEEAVRQGHASAADLLDALFGASKLEVLQNQLVQYACPCSKERVMRALSTLTNLDLVEMIREDGKADIDCDFCAEHYHVTEAELREILAAIDERDAARAARAAKESSGLH